jgi:heme exporter protein A
MANRQAAIAALNIDKLTVLRSSRMILREFSLSAKAGEIVWIKGANGSGKSTLLRAVAGLLPFAAGQCDATGRIAFVDEYSALDSDQTADEVLRFWARFDGTNGNDIEKALVALDLVPLTDIPIRLLSAGQRRRVALARLIAGKAQIWLLDEPYNALDQANSARLDTAIADHISQGGIAIIASHIAPGINASQTLSLDRTVKAAA